MAAPSIVASAAPAASQPKKKKKKKKNKNKGGGVVDNRAKQTRDILSGNQAASATSGQPAQQKKPGPTQGNANLVEITPNRMRIPQVASPVARSPVAEEKVTPEQVDRAFQGSKNNTEREGSKLSLSGKGCPPNTANRETKSK